MRTILLFTLALTTSACVVDLENALCEEDANCPADQWCTSEGRCRVRLPTIDEACEQIVKMGATRAATCYGGQRSTWEQDIPAANLCAAVKQSTTNGTLAFDASKIRQCKAAIASRPCELISVPGILQGCEMFTPVSGLGDACGTPYDCTQGWCNAAAACPGQCTAFIADDQPCTDADKCGPSSTCQNGYCRAYRNVDEACSTSDIPCQPYLAYCDGDPGICRAKRQTGACSIGQCVATYNCTPPFFGTCNPSKTIGDPCTPGQYQCEFLAHCSDVTNQCESINTSGGGCGFNFEGEIVLFCVDAYCSGGTCANHLAPRQTCNNSGECGYLSNCDGTCIPDFCF